MEVAGSLQEAGRLRSRERLGRGTAIAWWAGRFTLALFLFVGALQLMKTGAAALSILQEGRFLVANAGSTLGLGWIGSLLVLSGSPIAASAVALVAAGEQSAASQFTELQGFTMLTGSRLGAAFVVLVTAAVYALRGGTGQRLAPLSTAVIALTVTAFIYVPSAFLGGVLLMSGSFSGVELSFPGGFAGLLDLIYGDMLAAVAGLPAGVLFLGGLGALLVSFKVIDTVLPNLEATEFDGSRLAWLRRKWPMFGIGCLVALVTMSVSVALTVLVPLVAKKYVQRQHIVPYIMGANVTTLGDTMLAAFALDSPAAVRIVLVQAVAATTVSLFLLVFFESRVFALASFAHRVVLESRTRLALFTLGLFTVPLTVIGVSGLIG